MSELGEKKSRHYKNQGHARRRIEEEELERLLVSVDKIRPELRGIVLLGADSGMRISEAVHARWRDIVPDRRRIKVIHAKGNKSRFTVLTERTASALWELEQMRLAGRKPRRPTNRGISHLEAYPDAMCPISKPTLQEWFRVFLVDAGLPCDLSFHSLRHRFATELLRRGLPINDLSMLLGHVWLESTAQYLHSTSDRFSKAHVLMGKPPENNPPQRPCLKMIEGGGG